MTDATDRAPGAAVDDLIDGEPSLLGAAAPLAVEGGRRQRRADRRSLDRQRREAAALPPVELGDYSDTVYVFDATRRGAPALRPYLRSLWERRHFMVELARADLRARRSNTILGGLWSVLDPLFQAGIYYMLFTIIQQGNRPTEFLHVLIGGIFLLQLVLGALTDGARSIRGGKYLMLNSAFPRALLPLTTVCRGVMSFGPAVFVYALFHVLLGSPYGWGLALLPVLFVLQVVLMIGIALLVSTIVVFFQDAGNAVQYVGRILFFTTPVIYPVTFLPDDLRAWLAWQPLFALFASYQEILDGGVPDLTLLVQVPLWAIAFLVVGATVFLRHEREFALRV